MSLYSDAVENWAEDEASLSASMALSIFEEEGQDYYHQWLIKERAHFVKIFNDDNMMNRFTKKFNELTSPTTNLYM